MSGIPESESDGDSSAANAVGTGTDLVVSDSDFEDERVRFREDDGSFSWETSGVNSNSQTGHSTGKPSFLSGMASFPLQFGQRTFFIGWRLNL